MVLQMSTDWRSIQDEREKYQAYLCSREWAEKRQAVKERSGDRCERCRILPMEACHHLTYARKYSEKLEDLQAICNACHEYTHGKADFDPKVNCEWLAFVSQLEKLNDEFIDDFSEVIFLAREFPRSIFFAYQSRILNEFRAAWNEFAFVETQKSAVHAVLVDCGYFDSKDVSENVVDACRQFVHGNACVELSVVSFFTQWFLESCPKPPVSGSADRWLKYWGCHHG